MVRLSRNLSAFAPKTLRPTWQNTLSSEMRNNEHQVTSPPGMAAASGTLAPEWTDHKGARVTLLASLDRIFTSLRGMEKFARPVLDEEEHFAGVGFSTVSQSAPFSSPASNRTNQAPGTGNHR